MKLRHTLFHSDSDGSWRDLGLLIARVGFSGTLLWRHGVSKIPGLVADPVEFLDPLGLGPAVSLALATFAECVCAFALALGILSRFACLVLVINFGPLHCSASQKVRIVEEEAMVGEPLGSVKHTTDCQRPPGGMSDTNRYSTGAKPRQVMGLAAFVLLIFWRS